MVISFLKGNKKILKADLFVLRQLFITKLQQMVLVTLRQKQDVIIYTFLGLVLGHIETAIMGKLKGL
jgi:mannose/fructose/N-acetylgalactosamine-specific phosphotransferase system component IIC